jgi:hypothetical protein
VLGASDPEAAALETYLQNEGNLYLEGGDCFNYDPGAGGYDIQPWFGLGSGDDGSDDLFGIIGLNNLSVFSFLYNGENNWMDELNPLSSIAIWQNNQNSDISGVFNTSFGSGKAIGVVPSFGGLVDNATPLNTEKQTIKGVASEGRGSIPTKTKIREAINENRRPFVKKAAWYPELKRQISRENPLYNMTLNGLVMLANTKTDLMAAYLDLFGVSNAPQISVTPAIIDIDLLSGELSTEILTIANTGGAAAPDLEFSIAENSPVDWLSVAPDTGSVPGGQSLDVALQFDATALTMGFYNTTLKITSNDTANPELDVAVTLEIVAAANIAVNPDSITFDTTFVNQQKTANLTVYNWGAGDMFVSGILSTQTYFSADPAQFTVLPGESQTVTVTFAPTLAGYHSGMLKIASNDPVHDTLAVPLEGVAEIEVGINDAPQLPAEFAVSPNYPNPFNPGTAINYQLPRMAEVRLVIYNVLGQQVSTLISGQVPAGYHQAVWDGRNNADDQLGSGVYLYIFQAGEFKQVRKMILMK